MSEYFPRPRPLERTVKCEVVFCNYVAKVDLENAAGKIDTAKIAKNVNLAR